LIGFARLDFLKSNIASKAMPSM